MPQPGYPSMPQPGYPSQPQMPAYGDPSAGGFPSYPQQAYPGMPQQGGMGMPPQGGYAPAYIYGDPNQQQQMPPQQQQQVHMQPNYGAAPQMSMAPVKKGTPTVPPVPNFDPSNDAKILRKAMKVNLQFCHYLLY